MFPNPKFHGRWRISQLHNVYTIYSAVEFLFLFFCCITLFSIKADRNLFSPFLGRRTGPLLKGMSHKIEKGQRLRTSDCR